MNTKTGAKNRILSVLLSLTLIMSIVFTGIPAGVLTVNAAGGNWAGNGTQATPYIIEDVADLAKLAETVNSGTDYQGEYFKLTADIDLSGFVANGETVGDDLGWQPIGNNNNPFKGSFDGNGHTIQNLTINRPDTDFVGLFGYIGDGGAVENLGISGGDIKGNNYVGGVVGLSIVTITNCYNTGTVSGASYVGGVVGYNYITVENCYNTGAVSGTSDRVGGVVGYNTGTVGGCCNTGVVSGTGNYVGGVVGYDSFGTITYCYNTGAVTGASSVGGVAGGNYQSTVTSCYNTGAVNGANNVGGVLGWNFGSTITGCYFDKDTTGQSNGVGSNASATSVTGLTTAQMVAEDVLETTGDMSGLGAAFEKRDTDTDNCYYPELKVFKTNGDTAAQAASKASVALARRTPALAAATGITYGQALSVSTLTNGTAADPVTGGAVAGTFAWDDGTIVPTVADSGITEYDYTFTPTYSDLYKSVSSTLKITVSKIDQTGIQIEQSDMTLDLSVAVDKAGVQLTASGGSGTGAVTWNSGNPDIATVDNDGKLIPVSTGTVTITVTKAADGDHTGPVSDSIAVTVVDKTDLRGTINDADALLSGSEEGDKNGQYPKTAMDAFGNAITAANTVRDNQNAAQDAIDSANSTLQTAMDALKNAKIVVDYSKLDDLIEETKKFTGSAVKGDGDGQYPASAMTALQKAIDDAQAVADNDKISQQTVDTAYDNLNKALANFKVSKITIKKDDITKTVDEAKKLIEDADIGDKPGQYPQKAADELQKAIDDANAVINKPGVTDEEIAKAYADLQKAIDAFKASVNKKVDDTSPATGDDFNAIYLWICMASSAGLLVVTVRSKKRRKA